MLLNKLPNDRVTIECKASLHKFIENARQGKLRDFQEDVDILGKPWSAPEHRGQATEQGVANVVLLEYLAENLDSSDEISGQVLRCFRHVPSQNE